MWGHHLRRWPHIKPTLAQRILFFITSETVFSYKLRDIVGFGLVEMAISTNPKPTIFPPPPPAYVRTGGHTHMHTHMYDLRIFISVQSSGTNITRTNDKIMLT